MGKPVAAEGDVKPDVGKKDPPGADPKSGTWEAGKVEETPYDFLKIDSAKVIYEAKCTFTYKNGTTGAPNSVKLSPDPTEDVTLKAKATLLQHSGSFVLVDGDEAEGPVGGNKLKVESKNPLSSG